MSGDPLAWSPGAEPGDPTPTGQVLVTEAPKKRGGLVGRSLVVGAGTGLSRITGLIRVLAVTAAFGSGLLSDAYNVANITPNLIYELMLGGILSATLVPVFVDHLDNPRRGEGAPEGRSGRHWQRARPGDDGAIAAICSVATAGMLVLTVVGVLAAPLIMRLFTLAKDPAEARELASVGVPFMRWFLPQILFYGLTTLGTSLLNARRQFTVPAFAPVLNNVIVSAVLIGTHFAYPQLGLGDVQNSFLLELVIGFGTTLGIMAMTFVLIPPIRKQHFPLYWNPDWRHPAVKQVLRLSGWTAGYVVSNQIALLVVEILANKHGGDYSDYTYAFVFFQLPHGLIAVSLMTVLEPELAKLASQGNIAGFIRRFTSGLRLVLFVVAPAALGLVLVARPLIAGVLVRGNFKPDSAALTGDILALMAVGLIGFSTYLYTLQGFYCFKDTRTPFYINVGENALNVVFAVALYPSLGVQGLGLAYALAYSASAVVALVMLKRKRLGGSLGGGDTARSIAISLVAAATMLGLGLLLFGRGTQVAVGFHSLGLAIIAVGAGAVLYAAATMVFVILGPRYDQRRLLRGNTA